MIKVSGFTTQGKIKSVNEDSIFAKRWIFKDQEIAAIAVADGMGGYDCGEVHSQTAIKILKEHVQWEILNIENSQEILDQCFSIIDHLSRLYNQENMKQGGTTLTVAVIIETILIMKNIGDTRCFFIRNGVVEQLSEDHAIFDTKGNKTSTLTKCLGMGMSERAYTTMRKLQKGDIVIITSDGFYNKLDENEMIKIAELMEKQDETVISSTIQTLYDRGENDNISIVFFQFT